MQRVVITGIGAICGNAGNYKELGRACAEGISGIRPVTVFDGSVLLTDKFGEAQGITDKNRLYELIRRSCEEMLKDAGLDKAAIADYGADCRMFYGTLLSTSDTYLQHSEAAKKGKEDKSLALMNEFARYAAELTGVRGITDISSAACASGTTALGMAFDFIRNGLCECAVAGGADSLNRISAYGFNALKSLTKSVCNPYDVKHDGITIGECGAFFMVESLSHALARKAKIYCEIIGYATGNDAYHITSPEPNGIEACHTMLSAIDDAGISPENIEYINGHGTGTVINDTMETKAVNLLCEVRKKPHVSSTKALIGHCMGASGAIELASVIAAMNSGKPIKMQNLTEPLDGDDMFDIPDKIDITYALSNSFGFAGNSACIVIKKYEGAEV